MSDPKRLFLLLGFLCLSFFPELHRAETSAAVTLVQVPSEPQRNAAHRKYLIALADNPDASPPSQKAPPTARATAKAAPPQVNAGENAAPRPSSLIQLLEGREDELLLWLAIAITFFIVGWICGGNFYLRRERKRIRKLRF